MRIACSLIVFAALLLICDSAFAASGEGIFREAGINIVCKVLPNRFGAMVSGFAGIFALVSAVVGNFRGAWALVFVSVGCYISAEMVGILFSSIKC